MTLLDLVVLQSAADGTLTRSERVSDRNCWFIDGQRDVTKEARGHLLRGLITVEATNGQVTTGVLTAAGREALDRHRLAVVAETTIALIKEHK